MRPTGSSRARRGVSVMASFGGPPPIPLWAAASVPAGVHQALQGMAGRSAPRPRGSATQPAEHLLT